MTAAMWQLILPPIVVVLCLAFVLWYLSFRGSHPAIALRVEETITEARGGVSLWIRRFGLTVLEKWAQRIKVYSLRIHNTLNGLVESLRRRRHESQRLESAIQEEGENVSVPMSGEGEGETSPREPLPYQEAQEPLSQADGGEFDLDAPIQRVRKTPFFAPNVAPRSNGFPEKESVQKPLISDRVVRPERGKKKQDVAEKTEEALIARIASNPKEHAAYEALGDYYLDHGNIRDAKECYKQVLRLSPVHRAVRQKIRRLERIVEQGK